jgi:hypothetical protein
MPLRQAPIVPARTEETASIIGLEWIGLADKRVMDDKVAVWRVYGPYSTVGMQAGQERGFKVIKVVARQAKGIDGVTSAYIPKVVQ